MEATRTLTDEELDPGARDVRDRFLAHGASPALTAEVLGAVRKSGAPGTFAIDVAAKAIGNAIPILPSPKRPKGSTAPHVFAFVGPTGSGKTTTLAKLGRALMGAGRRLVFASFDAVGLTGLERIGGLDADIDRSEVPLVAVQNAEDLERHLKKRGGADVVLLDTPGFSPRDEEGMDQLAIELERIGERAVLVVFLVLPATKSRSGLHLALQRFANMAPSACVITKLDETQEPAAALEEIVRGKIPIAFLCDGQDARGHILRPTPDRFADLFLRGRIG